MQCTNYTGDENNFKNINLNVINTLKKNLKNNIILGLSDHTIGYATVLGAVALGAGSEKHFTDSNLRNGPDHKFSMTPTSWSNMVKETRRLEKALGDGIKKVESNEKSQLLFKEDLLKQSKILKKVHY